MIFGAKAKPTGVEYIAWAPDHEKVALEIHPGSNGATHRKLVMKRDPLGQHVAVDPQGHVGDRYHFLLPDGKTVPDPGSRAQADSVHDLSVVIDPATYSWTDTKWKHPPFRDLVIYELQIGTFTPAGTFRAAIEKLPHLRDPHVNAIEIIPIGNFPGRWNWGYDGVLIYAPSRAYGSPDDLRALVDAAHRQGSRQQPAHLEAIQSHRASDHARRCRSRTRRLRDRTSGRFEVVRRCREGRSSPAVR